VAEDAPAARLFARVRASFAARRLTLGRRARLAGLVPLLLVMAVLPVVFAPDATLLGIPDPALVLFAAGLYLAMLIGLEWWGALLVGVCLFWFIDQLNSTQLDTAYLVALTALLGLGLNVVVGYAGMLDLGFVAFFAIGAYTWGALNSPFFELHYSFWLVAPLGIAVAAVAGILLGIPVLKLRGDYLAIVTLGFGEIIGRLSNNLGQLTGGAVGIYGIGAPVFLPFITDRPLEQLVYLTVVCCFVVAFATRRLRDSRTGRAWEAIREDEDVAAAMGVNTVYYKLLAFAIGAAVGGLGGALFAAKVSAISPPNFVLDLSVRAVAVIIIGGMGSIPGVIMGAIVLVGVPEILRSIQEWRLVIYGAVLVAMMILRPEGIIPSRRRALELHTADAADAALTAPESQ
jgi:branched-chain amino acid transport system permease protein